jgi:hypothetical protein
LEQLHFYEKKKKKKTYYGFVISGPRIKGVPFGKEAKGMEVPSGDNAALGQYNTIMSRMASSDGVTPFGAIGGVPPCFRRPLKSEAVFGLRITYIPGPKRWKRPGS